MKDNKKLFTILLILALVVGGATVLYNQLKDRFHVDQLVDQNEDTEEKEKAPDFIVYDLEGNEVHLTDYFGKPIVLNFWASWCGPCQMEMPDFEKMYLQMGEEIHFLMINVTDGGRETLKSASDFIKEKGYTFTVFYDLKLDASNTYGIQSFPTTLFIDKDGYPVAYAVGAIDEATLKRGIDMIK